MKKILFFFNRPLGKSKGNKYFFDPNEKIFTIWYNKTLGMGILKHNRYSYKRFLFLHCTYIAQTNNRTERKKGPRQAREKYIPSAKPVYMLYNTSIDTRRHPLCRIKE